MTSAPARRRQDIAWYAAVAALAVVGVVVRVVLARGRWGTLDSDEAVVGLIARRMLHGHVRAFYWKQDYAGTIEPAVVALLGATKLAMRVVPAALCAASCVTLWRVGRRFMAERTAQAAALLMWVAPGAFVWWSVKERGFYWVCLLLGLLTILLAQRIVERQAQRADVLLFGVVAGAGFWTSPNILYFAVPAGVWVIVRMRRDLVRLLPAVPAAIVGALPWLWHNTVVTHLASLKRPPQPETVSYFGGIGRLGWRVLPMELNLRYPISERWLWSHVGTAVFLAVCAGLVAAVAVRRDRPTLIAAAAVVFPFLYALFPGAWWVGEGRYGVFAVPLLAVLLAWAIRRPELVLVLAALAAVGSYVVVRPAGGGVPPNQLGGDIRALHRLGVDTTWADYWVAYRLAFESRDSIEASTSNGWRDKSLLVITAADRTPAFLYTPDDPRIQRLLAAEPDARVVRIPHFVVVMLDHPVEISRLPARTVP